MRFTPFLIALLSYLNLQAQEPYFLNGEFYDEVDQVMKSFVKDGTVDYSGLLEEPALFNNIMGHLDHAELEGLEDASKKAFYLNAYNLTVIKSVLLEYPIASPEEVPGFFREQKHLIAGEEMTLDFLENGIIRPQCEDPRVHFVLVCGAVGCPPIINEAYRPEKLEEQLNRQTMKALSDPGFVQLENNSRKAGLSKIFDWYTEDFGADKSTSLINYINQYRVEKIPNDYKVSFYPYDWTLNDSNAAIVNGGQANSPKTKKAGPGNNRFIVSALYDRGEYELNLFNNYFTQERPGPGTQRERVNFFSPLFQFLVGINKRVNVGFDLRFRSVNLALVDESAVFEALRFRNDGFETTDSFTGYSRTGFSAIGPKLKWQPFRAKSNITIQHTLYFPMFGSEDLEGNSENGYLDWDTPSMINQIFYDQPIGRKLGFFAEVDFNIDNMGDAINKNEFDYYQISTPLTTILSYFPKDEITIYGLLGYAPQWGYFVDVPEPDQTEVVSSYIPFNQLGLGFKYLLKNGLQFEVLVVDFNGAQEDSRSATYNFGVRYIGRK